MNLFKQISFLKKLGVILFVYFLILLMSTQAILAQDVIWFSNMPPKSEIKTTTYGMHKLSSIKGKRGKSSIVQWLRQGTNINMSEYPQLTDTNSFDFFLFSPKQNQLDGKFITKGGSSFLSYASVEEGYYSAYLLKRRVSNDTLYVDIAKADMLNHSCRNGHKNALKMIGPDSYPKYIPAEIIRKRDITQNLHYFAASGDEINYEILINGKPYKGAELTFITQTDWRKTKMSDENGNSAFQVLQDYFSPWQELNKRKTHYYLIYAKATVLSKGIYKNKNYSVISYTTSLSDSYRPAKTMYMSMVWALAVFVISVLITTIGIFIYRNKRRNIYREEVLSEKN